MERKDQAAADAAETTESRANAELWITAKLERDSYVTYKKLWNIGMFQEVMNNVRQLDVKYYMENPYSVPYKFHETLLELGRKAFMDSFEETNSYYRMLMGLPDIGDTDYIYLSEELQEQFHTDDTPVHLLSTYIQDQYLDTDEYQLVLASNPDKSYLRYLGSKKIDLYTARTAKDFDIIRYPSNRTDINPYLLQSFSSLYADYREYVMMALYNEKLSETIVNYRTFMGVLIMSFTLSQICNKALEGLNTKHFMDDTVLHTMLSMYGLPDNILMTKETRRNLVASLARLVKEKGTSDVYYDLIDILGYQDVVVSKLLLMKGQQFESGEATDSYEPYFIQVDLKDEDPYSTITSGKAPIYTYHEIIGSDPLWWDLPDVRQILQEKKYSVADSKYITIEAIIHQMKYVFESVYFTRMILDNKSATDEFMIEIPDLFGTKLISIYDLILFIICATCMVNGLSGEIFTESDELLATAGFNFDRDIESFNEFLSTTQYVDKDRLNKFLSNLSLLEENDIPRLFDDVISPLREWLEKKIVAAVNRKEYLEYEAIYKALFTYDITRNKFLDDFQMPLDTIKDTYAVTDDEMEMYKHFYPRIGTRAITIDEFNENVNTTKYHYPFLNYTTPVDWYVHVQINTMNGIEDRGYLYFHDILNSDDVRELTNQDGTRIFMDYEDADVGWQINQAAVDKAIELINALDDDALHQAYFQIYTPATSGDVQSYAAGTRLPSNIRSGLYKSILIDKIKMDCNGLAVLPKTYFESLYRKNETLYNLLTDDDRFNRNRDAWINDVITVVTTVESSLSMHLKYFEQSVLGESLFFKPLISLINHFKSILVDISKTGLKYVFDDKMDIGGNSNMFKLFDEMPSTIHKFTIGGSGYDSNFGLFDVEHKTKHRTIIHDRSQILVMVGDKLAAHPRTATMGSFRIVDEVKVFKNGDPVDPNGFDSVLISGEPGSGRWPEEDDIHMKTYSGSANIKMEPADLDGWKDFVESITPTE